ncbi:MAG: YidC/Oxa1 family membrane protein insertase [Patescibacteria group bacterium]|jgi:YidC/Oxa1 family membrane protein insertase
MKQFFFVLLYQPLYNLLIFLAWLVPGHSIGWSIIVLTILIRLALLPSSLKAAHFQAKNNKLQPHVNKIRKEITDKQEQTKAIMELYKTEGHSPLGSCLQSLIQLPVLIVLYNVFRSGLNETGFKDLYSFTPHPDTVNTMFFGMNIVHPDLWALPIIAAVLQFGLSYLMMPKKIEGAPDDPAAAMSKQMLFLGPIITLFFGRSMPAALVIYWIVTTLFSLVLQYFVNKQIHATPLVRDGGKALPAPKVEKAEKIEPVRIEKPSKKEMLYNIMNKRLDKKEKKSGVNVTVRTKKKW